MPAEFHWIRPAWLLAVPVVIAFAVFFARRQLGPGSWQHVIAPALKPHVLSRSATRAADYRWWLLALAGVMAVVAIAGPAWQRIEQPVFRSEQAVVIALDLSRSMDAQDVAPSRLLRARLKILDLLEERGSGQTALIVYSANAFTVTPLTSDTDTIAALVNSLSTDIMPSRGSYPAVAINKGRALLQQAGVGAGEVLLITDGGSTPTAEKAARELRVAGFTLSVLGVGTTEGAPIPRQTGGFVTDQFGQIAVPKLEERSLKSLAAAGGGRFATLTADASDIEILYSGEAISSTRTDESLATDQWREEGPWLLLLLLPLAAMAFRRGWVLVALVIVMPVSQPAHASFWDDIWLNKDQQAKKMLEGGGAADAAATFENRDWQAIANYRAGNFRDSAAEFAEHEDARNLYNLGNALAMQGEFESAIDAYDKVLQAEPGHEDAAYNRDVVQQLLEQQQQQQQQQQQEQQQGEGEQSDGEGESDPNQEGQDGESQADGDSEQDESTPGEEGEEQQDDLEAMQEELRRAAEEAKDGEQPQQLSQAELEELRRQREQEQAMEQWLRRIPNDPGGLLRRKFRYQYQRSDVDQDGNRLWPDDNVQPW
ncbi:MAG: VWA domain-containing protein [Woeseiaceae bacterium]|nr:VWA domain-containing protein [Woeseiaceae bacterium]